MSTYKSGETIINAPAQAVYARLSNLENLKNFLQNVPEDKIPEDKRQMLEQIVVTPTSISLPGGPVGSVTLELTKCVEPSLIELSGVGTPVAMKLMVNIAEETAETSSARVALDIDIPMMLKPMVGGTLQKMVDQFGSMLSVMPF